MASLRNFRLNREQARLVFTFFVFVVLASLDNAAVGVLPPLFAIIARDLAATEAALGLVTAVQFLILALSAAYWGFRGDRGSRKKLLLFGTLFWGTAMSLSGLAQNFVQFLIFQMVTAVGVGSISAVGFSVISDMIPAHRRGLALSLWSISQTLGAAGGALLAGTLGAFNWRWPFFFIAGLGFLFALLYLFTREPQRGRQEPELAQLYAAGHRYTHRINFAQLRDLLRKPSNAWLLTQAFLMALAFGATTWVPRWAIARVQAEGYSLETATIVGNLVVTLFGVGLFLAIFAGHLGDKWQRRMRNGRAKLAALGLIGSTPFFILLYALPLHGLAIPDTNNLLLITWAVIVNLFTNGWLMLVFLAAFMAMALYAAEPPNWAALITDVNLPEHRGTIVGFSRIARASGNALSIALVGFIFAALSDHYAPPDNYAVGLILFQLIAIPAGLCYYGAGKHIPRDTGRVKRILQKRGRVTSHTSSAPS